MPRINQRSLKFEQDSIEKKGAESRDSDGMIPPPNSVAANFAWYPNADFSLERAKSLG
jgi:hypothetical protein